MTVAAGDYDPNTIKIIHAKTVTTALNKGDLVKFDAANGFAVSAAINGEGPFGVMVKAKPSGPSIGEVAVWGIVYVTAGDAINPQAKVFTSATSGRVSGTAGTGDVIGMYLAHENEGDGVTVPTAAAAAEIVRIFLTIGGGTA